MIKYHDVCLPTQVVQYLICDKCKKKIYPNGDDLEWQEVFSYGGCGGYGSVFGDGREFEIQLCQDCFYKLIKPYMRYVND